MVGATLLTWAAFFTGVGQKANPAPKTYKPTSNEVHRRNLTRHQVLDSHLQNLEIPAETEFID